jgi:ribosome-associated protein
MKRAGSGGGDGASGAKPRPAAPAKRSARRLGGKPRIRATHGAAPDLGIAGGPRGRAPVEPRTAGSPPRRAPRPLAIDTGAPTIKPKAPGAGLRKAPLAGPKRAAHPGAHKRPAADLDHGPSSEARALALALAAAAIEKKAIGIEILDVTGKVDYADFLVVMTGRSDRHVHAIATGIEEAMRKRKHAPLSMEGLSAATWVLMDFGDVVVHVFQEHSRALYDIEGLWIDAGRVPVPVAHEAVDGRRPETPPPAGD